MSEPTLPPVAQPTRAPERRVSVRYPLEEPVVCRLGSAREYESRWARIRDISASGVGLRLSAALEPGCELTVEFTETGSSLRRSLPARVVHSTAQPDGTWLVGCRFHAPLNDEELRRLLAGPTQAESVPVPSSRGAEPPPGKSALPVILVADDDPAIRHLLERALRLHGLAAQAVASGTEAVEAVRRQPGDIDLALLDLQMPGQDGLTTLAALEQLKPGLRCCVMSGGVGDEESLYAAGARCVLRKPFTLADVARCLEALREGTP